MTPERFDELIALAGLGELSATDERELDVATRDDPALRAEVDEALSTASDIQRSLAETPPPTLRAGVLAAISETPQEKVSTESTDCADVLSADTVATPVVSLGEERSRRRRALPLVLGAAAAAVVFLIGAFIVSNEAAAPDQYAAVIEASDAQAHNVVGELGTLTVTYSESHDAMVVVGDGIPTVGDDETYQLWFDIDGHMTPAGLFRPDEDGHVEERIEVTDGTGSSINVTEEPAGGSEAPTLPVLASSA